jgi:uncharacterized delta-60 repeat protein
MPNQNELWGVFLYSIAASGLTAKAPDRRRSAQKNGRAAKSPPQLTVEIVVPGVGQRGAFAFISSRNHDVLCERRRAMNPPLPKPRTSQLARLFTRIKESFAQTLALVLAAILTLPSPAAFAQLGALDTLTYGPYSGLAYGRFPDITAQFFKVHDAIVLPDDRVVAGGACIATGASPAGTRFCIAVWNSNGTGVALYVHSSSINRVSSAIGGALALQPDGKIVITAPCRYSPVTTVTQFCTARFNANFTSDTTFATGFSNVAPSPSLNADSYANAIALQPDGKIVIGGQCGVAPDARFCAARLLPDGNPDDTFGSVTSLRSFLAVEPLDAFDRVKRIAIAPDGKIYLGGDCKADFGLLRPCAVRLNADGSIDNAWLTTALTPRTLLKMSDSLFLGDTIYDMVVQANGEFVFAGSCRNLNSSVLVPCALRMAEPSATQFQAGLSYAGATVPVTTTPGPNVLREPVAAGSFSIVRVYLQPDGKMLALLKDESSTSSYRVRRYNEDGSIDANWAQPAFDFNAAADNAAGFSRGLALAQQNSGKVMVAGYTQSNSATNPQARVIRMDNRGNPGRNCSADIDGDGKVLATTDGLLLARASLGMTGNVVLSGALGLGAQRNTWEEIRDYLITQCGMKTVLP